MLMEKNMTAIQLQEKAAFSANITPRMKWNGYVSLGTFLHTLQVLYFLIFILFFYVILSID